MGYDIANKYWNSVFSKLDLPGKVGELAPRELEEGLQWLSRDCASLLDFGFGTGTMLLRSLFLGAEKAVGIDLSAEALKLLKKRLESAGFKDRTVLLQGKTEKLIDLEDKSFDGIILSNVLDNLEPSDGLILIEEVTRLLRPKGRLLVKLNPYFTEEVLVKNNFIRVEEDFYKEPDGMNLWNLSTEIVISLFKGDFSLVEQRKIYFEKFKQYNRLFKFTKS